MPVCLKAKPCGSAGKRTVRTKPGEDLARRIFIDKNLVEVFANDRQAAVAAAGKYDSEKLGIGLFSRGGDVEVKKVKGWKMKSIYMAR